MILEILRMARCSFDLYPEIVQKTLMVSKDRTQEALKQLAEMGFIKSRGKTHHLSKTGKTFLDAALNENLPKMHETLIQYSPYATVYRSLQQSSGTISEISQKTGMSHVTVDTILRLIGWTHPELTKNPDTGGHYLAFEKAPLEKSFLKKLMKTYQELSNHPFGIRRRYVKISILRERVCEQLGITREVFDKLLRQSFSKHNDLIELASAPLIEATRATFTLTPMEPHYCYLRIVGEP